MSWTAEQIRSHQARHGFADPLAPAPVVAVVAEEKPTKAEQQSERELQREISQYLRLHGIWFDQDSMIRRRSGTKGSPDFLFVYRKIPIGCEAKTETGRCSKDQLQAHDQMRANGWRIVIARSVADLQSLMREIDGIRPPPLIPSALDGPGK